MTEAHADEYWFPGRWLGGASMILGPCLLLVGVLLRLPYPFFFKGQLAAFEEHPTRMLAASSVFAAGNALLWPAIAALARLIGATRPGWATWGGGLAMFGLFARTFHAGVDHLAFQLVPIQGREVATRAVADSYGAFHIFRSLSFAILSGWIVLAVGAYRSGVLRLVRSIALGLISALMIGVLKGSDATSVVATAGLCAAVVPLGVGMLRAEPVPETLTVICWSLLVSGLIATFFVLGQLG